MSFWKRAVTAAAVFGTSLGGKMIGAQSSMFVPRLGSPSVMRTTTDWRFGTRSPGMAKSPFDASAFRAFAVGVVEYTPTMGGTGRAVTAAWNAAFVVPTA